MKVRALLLSMFVVIGVLVPVAPASAHSVGGVGATNFRTTLDGLTPAVQGVRLSVVENGSRLQLRNDTDTPVVVYGYQGEQYARIGPDGVFLNDNSPATYLNASRDSDVVVPERADPTKPPAWRKVASATFHNWHDHRTHWMLKALPAAVAAAPGAYHRISDWTVTLDHGGTALTATGTLDWVPGPRPWPWLTGAVLLAVAVTAVGLLRRPQWWLASATAVLLFADLAHGIGIGLTISGTALQRLGAFVGAVVGQQTLPWLIAGFAVVLLVRRRIGAVWLAATAGLAILAVSGLSDMATLWRSSAPTALPLTVDRVTVVVALGVGLGLLGALPLVRWRQRRPAAERPDGSPAALPDRRPVALPEDTGTPKPVATAAEPSASDVGEAGAASRRQLVGYAAAAGLGGLAGMGLGVVARPPASTTAASRAPSVFPLSVVGSASVPFRAAHQAGITTPSRQQAHATITAYDLRPGTTRDALGKLLRGWTQAADRLTVGEALGATDTMTAGTGPASLTLTVAFGPSIFDKVDLPAAARPAALTSLPPFPGERLDPSRSDGDLALLVCADDPLVVFQATHALTRLATASARSRWQMSGFTRAHGAASTVDATPRNLMGHLDGTNNPRPTDPDFDKSVFVDTGPAWLRGGSYLVVRRIRIDLHTWDALDLTGQEKVIGRRKDTGAPLTGQAEHDAADYGARTTGGDLVIPANAHIRLANLAFNNGARILRRGYSFADGAEAGLLFLAWQADPRTGFIPIQRRLARDDALNRFVRHETSALFAAPPGAAVDGAYLGQGLVEA